MAVASSLCCPATDRPTETCGLLLVGNFLSATGLNRSVGEELAARLGERGWPLLTTSHRRNKAWRLIDMVATAWRRRREYEVAQVDVFSGPAFRWAEAACFALRRAGKPYILTLHGGNLPQFAAARRRRVEKLLASAAVVTAPSGFLQQALAPFRPQNDIRVLPNAIALERYSYRERSHPVPRLVWLRAFDHIYNPTLAPHFMADLLRDFPTAQLAMLGPDKGDGSLQATQQLANELGVARHISFPGGIPKTEVPRWLGEADIFLNTTNIDNTPVSVLEAMACGLPVVTTNVGGLPYLARHNENALLVPPQNAAAMANETRRLLCEPGLAGQISRAARETAAACDWQRILPQWEELFCAVKAGAASGMRAQRQEAPLGSMS